MQSFPGKKKKTSETPSSALNLEMWNMNFLHRYSIKLSRALIDLNIIKPMNAFWKDLMLYQLNLKLNSRQGLAKNKKGTLAQLDAKICKIKIMKIFQKT